jgi:hypothetical protein
MTALMFADIKGAFDHVAADLLVSMCKKLKLQLAFIRWLYFFLLQHSIQLRCNGQI